MNHVDGNAVIGALSLALGADASLAELVCASCGANHPVAEARVYLRCPGIVIRCPNCTTVEIVLVEIEHRFQITLANVANLRLQAVSP
jgi:hypothetical protein